jgi:hypothetical protein
MVWNRAKAIVALLCLLFTYMPGIAIAQEAKQPESQSPAIPRLVTIESNIPVAPQGWAVLERRLIDDMSEAAVVFTKNYTRSGGTLIWRTEGRGKVDDMYEAFYNFPLLYAMGGDERLRELSFKQFNAVTRNLTNNFPMLHKEFPIGSDWFHISEGMLFFYYLGLVDPTDFETVARAKLFAGLYLNEDPEAQNYDPKHRIIKSPRTGSLGPVYGSAEKARPYGSTQPGASDLLWGLPIEGLPGINTVDDLRNPDNARRMGIAMQERLERGDVASNLAATGLIANAYLYTGEQKYADWVKEYAGAWLERTRANGGITPDNVGLSGKVGEYHNGNWWGGSYGWRFPHGYYNLGMAFQAGAENAMLVSGGDKRYLEMPRSNLDHIIALGKNVNGAFVVPYKKTDKGWIRFRPLERQFLANLWNMSMDPADWQRIEKVRLSSTKDWHVATNSPYPNFGTANGPEPHPDCWNCDVEGLADWRQVVEIRNKEDRSHEGPWLRFIAGDNPDYPEKILSLSHGEVAWRLEKMRRGDLQIDYDPPRGMKTVDKTKFDITKVSPHHWHNMNPVTTEALIQLTLGAPQLIYNGGLLQTRLRYFDPANLRPGLPKDVAALVRKLSDDSVVVELVNLSPFESRDVIVQGGMYGEHQFTRVKYQMRTDRDRAQPDEFARGPMTFADQYVDVNRKFFQVRLPPATGLTLEIGNKRFANKPSYAFPWHGDKLPVR